MSRVLKKITSGASFGGGTHAGADLDHVLDHGFIPCGSGDNHTITRAEWKLVKAHDPANGDLTLPKGRLNDRPVHKKQLRKPLV